MTKKIDQIVTSFRDNYKKRSIQLIITIAFTTLAIVSMSFMEFFTYSIYLNNTREEAIATNKQIIDQVSWNLNSYIRNMMSISDSMYYNVIKNKDMTWDTIDKEMSLLYEANKDNLISIACVSQDGAVIEAVPVTTRKSGVDLKKQEWFTDAENGIENLHFSTPHVQNIFEGLLIGLIGSLIPLVLIYYIYTEVIVMSVDKFAALSDILKFMSVEQLFMKLLPISLILGIGVGVLGSAWAVRKRLKV